jgi:hypothetical protein
MGKCTTTIRRIEFDLSDEQITRVVVEQDYAGDCPLMDRRYEKAFPARIPIVDLFSMKQGEGGITDYLLWPR